MTREGFALKKITLVLLVVLFAAVAFAQDAPKAEVFGGYQYMSVDTKGLDNRQSFNGWDADVAFHVKKSFSIVADISGAYKSETFNDSVLGNVTGKIRVYNYLFGPRFSANAGKVTPFAEALFGIGHITIGAEASGANTSVSSNDFAMALGGGLDVNANKHFAIRLAKFDYVMNRINANNLGDTGVSGSENLNNFRFATGVVFKF